MNRNISSSPHIPQGRYPSPTPPCPRQHKLTRALLSLDCSQFIAPLATRVALAVCCPPALRYRSRRINTEVPLWLPKARISEAVKKPVMLPPPRSAPLPRITAPCCTAQTHAQHIAAVYSVTDDTAHTAVLLFSTQNN